MKKNNLFILMAFLGISCASGSLFAETPAHCPSESKIEVYLNTSSPNAINPDYESYINTSLGEKLRISVGLLTNGPMRESPINMSYSIWITNRSLTSNLNFQYFGDNGVQYFSKQGSHYRLTGSQSVEMREISRNGTFLYDGAIDFEVKASGEPPSEQEYTIWFVPHHPECYSLSSAGKNFIVISNSKGLIRIKEKEYTLMREPIGGAPARAKHYEAIFVPPLPENGSVPVKLQFVGSATFKSDYLVQIDGKPVDSNGSAINLRNESEITVTPLADNPAQPDRREDFGIQSGPGESRKVLFQAGGLINPVSLARREIIYDTVNVSFFTDRKDAFLIHEGMGNQHLRLLLEPSDWDVDGYVGAVGGDGTYPTATPDDYRISPNSTLFGGINVSANTDTIIEGTEYFQVKLKQDSRSPWVQIVPRDTVDFKIYNQSPVISATAPAELVEGESGTITVTVQNLPPEAHDLILDHAANGNLLSIEPHHIVISDLKVGAQASFTVTAVDNRFPDGGPDGKKEVEVWIWVTTRKGPVQTKLLTIKIRDNDSAVETGSGSNDSCGDIEGEGLRTWEVVVEPCIPNPPHPLPLPSQKPQIQEVASYATGYVLLKVFGGRPPYDIVASVPGRSGYVGTTWDSFGGVFPAGSRVVAVDRYGQRSSGLFVEGQTTATVLPYPAATPTIESDAYLAEIHQLPAENRSSVSMTADGYYVELSILGTPGWFPVYQGDKPEGEFSIPLRPRTRYRMRVRPFVGAPNFPAVEGRDIYVQFDSRNFSDFNNFYDRFDVTGDGVVSLNDLLNVVSYLQTHRSGPVTGSLSIWPDVNGDGIVSLADTLEMVNRLRR